MGICRNCGCEIVGGDGFCQPCASGIQDERQMNQDTTNLLLLIWKYVFKPLIPSVVVLTVFEKLEAYVLQATESVVLAEIVQYLGYVITTIILGWLVKQNIYKGLWKSYWTKAFIYYTGMLLFRSGLRMIKAANGTFEYNTQLIISDIFLVSLGIAQIIWLIRTNKLAKQSEAVITN
jgi:hypothetical protein